jgi:hypothetical protein
MKKEIKRISRPSISMENQSALFLKLHLGGVLEIQVREIGAGQGPE